MSAPNLYAKSAELYDLDPRPAHSDDIAFFVDRGTRAQQPVLELACGTGRVTIPVARAGVRIHGADLSAAMLSRLAAKLGALPPEVSGRITAHHANMASFSFPERFGLIFIPFRSFQSLTTRGEQLSCLRCVKAHLREGGRFIVNVFRPQGRLDHTWIAPPAMDWQVVDPATGERVTRRHARRHIDVQRQVIEVDMLFSIAGREEFSDPLKLAFFYPDQIEMLLQEGGFTIIESMGDYQGRPIGEGGELIYVCQAT